jgi:hypothetical protein
MDQGPWVEVKRGYLRDESPSYEPKDAKPKRLAYPNLDILMIGQESWRAQKLMEFLASTRRTLPQQSNTLQDASLLRSTHFKTHSGACCQ